jgi:hypothetical protein
MPGSAERILSLLQPGDHAAHWTEEFTKLSSLERDALAPMLLDIGLRRSVERRDFGAVAGLLAAGDALGLTDRPQASQAAELLHRLACFSEMSRIAQTA